MGYDAVRWALMQTARCQDKLVLAVIAHFADKSQKSWPSVRTIAVTCGLSVSSVNRSLAKLKELGLITIEPRFKNNRQTSNVYTLAVPQEQPNVVPFTKLNFG